MSADGLFPMNRSKVFLKAKLVAKPSLLKADESGFIET